MPAGSFKNQVESKIKKERMDILLSEAEKVRENRLRMADQTKKAPIPTKSDKQILTKEIETDKQIIEKIVPKNSDYIVGKSLTSLLKGGRETVGRSSWSGARYGDRKETAYPTPSKWLE